jgi:TPR repeat protein
MIGPDNEALEELVATTLQRIQTLPGYPKATYLHPVVEREDPPETSGERLWLEAGIFLVTEEGEDRRLGLRLLRSLAGRGYVPAFRTLALTLLREKNPDVVRAIRWLDEGMKAGAYECAFELARLYDLGELIEEDQEKAHFLYELAAEAGDRRAQHRLALRLLDGRPYKDDATAFRLMLKAAEGGSRRSKYALAVFYELGVGTTPNFDEAANLFEELALGAPDSGPALRLAKMLLLRQGSNSDLRLGAQWTAIAVEHGSPEAMVLLGKLLATGVGMNKDSKRALELFEAAAERGDEGAMALLAVLHSRGFGGLPPDPERVAHWITRGVELGYETLKYLRSLYHRKGTIFPFDPEGASRLEAELGPEALGRARQAVTEIEEELAGLNEPGFIYPRIH